MNHLVRVPGIVISASRSRAYVRQLFYRCSRCNTDGDPVPVAPMRKVSVPRACPRYVSFLILIASVIDPTVQGDRCPLDSNYIVAEKCTYVNQQTLKLQESPEDVPTGEMPRHIMCIAERHLVDRIVPGTRCSLVGYIDTFDQQKKVEVASQSKV